ncbi:G-protein alpha subunit [Mycena sanguinolenta]|nr:G-protein alpha subunit [Mycena sanguinolenta]
MGVFASQPDRTSKSRSDEIDRQLDEDSKRYRKECKILLLGSGESGKSTILKQMKIIYQSGFTEDERLAYRKTIHMNVLDSAQALVEAIRKYGMEDLLGDKQVCETILSAADGESGLGRELAEVIEVLWHDPVVSRVLDKHQSEFYLIDSAAYFLTDIHRLAHPDYMPTEQDVLRARAQSTAITETRFNKGSLPIHMFEVGGQRNEMRKWIHCFESITTLIFCTALSEYDQVLLEGKGQRNRMCESLILFESVINSRWFLRTSIILFLNKIDVFRVKLGKIPLELYFPEYTGGPDIKQAAKYILWRFVQTNSARLSVYPHITQATDTSNILLVFAAVTETILQSALKSSVLL